MSSTDQSEDNINNVTQFPPSRVTTFYLFLYCQLYSHRVWTDTDNDIIGKVTKDIKEDLWTERTEWRKILTLCDYLNFDESTNINFSGEPK